MAIVGLLVCVAALLACGGGSSAHARHVAPGQYRISCSDGLGYCYDEAERVCPFGYHVGSESERTSGASAHTAVMGNTALTHVRTESRGAISVQCLPPVFCNSDADCAQLGARCYRSRRLPGKNICK
jgi:hypothetical protein